MSLNKPAFESQESTDNAAEGTDIVKEFVQAHDGQAAQDGEKIAAEAGNAPAAEVAVAGTSALATASDNQHLTAKQLLEKANELAKIKGALEVNWEDFETIKANQGQFLIGQDKTQIGEEIELRMASWQEQWVSAPGDMDAEGDGLVLYSDDGINGSENSQVEDDHVEWLRANGVEDRERMTVVEHQKFLKEKEHDKAHVQHKVILVGKLLKANEKAMDFVGDLVQVHLPDTGRRAFQSHSKQSAFHNTEGAISAEDMKYLKLTAKLAGQGKKQFTQIKVGYAEGHGPKRG